MSGVTSYRPLGASRGHGRARSRRASAAPETRRRYSDVGPPTFRGMRRSASSTGCPASGRTSDSQRQSCCPFRSGRWHAGHFVESGDSAALRSDGLGGSPLEPIVRLRAEPQEEDRPRARSLTQAPGRDYCTGGRSPRALSRRPHSYRCLRTDVENRLFRRKSERRCGFTFRRAASELEVSESSAYLLCAEGLIGLSRVGAWRGTIRISTHDPESYGMR